MRKVFLGAAVFLFFMAIACMNIGWDKLTTSNVPVAMGLASLGFAVAGGLALLAAAVVKTDA